MYDCNTGGIINRQVWEKLLKHGEFIKFIHQAIEWENMLYFLYPYFWGRKSNWELRQYLQHPDPLHKIFLKAGSARVVLTIRPGFEREFAQLIATGAWNPGKAPYVTIAEEMQYYAKTNYPGIPSLNNDVDIRNARILVYPRQRKAWDDMQILMKLIEDYAVAHNGIYPKSIHTKDIDQDNNNDSNITDQEKKDAQPKPILKLPIRDPWNKEYIYSTGGPNGYEILSYGEDGVPGGSNDNADIYGLKEPPYGQKQRKAWDDMQILIKLIQGYAVAHGNYPTSLSSLKPPLTDPWGEKYKYKYPGDYGKYDLYTCGKRNGENIKKICNSSENDEEREEIEGRMITSWAEASLIGSWYEYTPTSAMDIEFIVKSDNSISSGITNVKERNVTSQE